MKSEKPNQAAIRGEAGSTTPKEREEQQSAASPRCRPGRHIFEPFTPSDDLGGGAQSCECGKLLIDRTLGGGRVVEIDDGVLRGR